LSALNSTGDFETIESGVGVEHPALVGYNGESPPLVVVSVLYWDLEGYWKIGGYLLELDGNEVEHCPALKEVICGL
jgi:hypothetical protein